MDQTPGPICEFTLGVRGEDAHSVDDRIEAVANGLSEPAAVTRVDTWALDDEAGLTRRIVRLAFADEAGLREFLDGPVAAVRERLAAAGGPTAEIGVRTLRGPRLSATAEPARCLNCDRILTGQYCGACGQRAQSRLISLVELVRDAFGDMFELDSRLWRTLIPLAVRPGVLTRDYLQGRRARYMPPFRMYLVLSLAFFVIAFFDPYGDLGILFAPDEPGTAAASVPADDDDPGLRVVFGNDEEETGEPRCEFDDEDVADMPQWLSRRLTPERLRAVCEDLVEEEGRGSNALVDRFTENIPAGLIILLPVMALVLKLLYPLSRRYYVEHLLFVVHYHAFVFLVLTVEVLFSRLLQISPLPEALGAIAGFAAVIYIPVYLYKSLRRVYGQGHLLTTFKFLVLTGCYFAGLISIILVAGLLAAFSA